MVTSKKTKSKKSQAAGKAVSTLSQKAAEDAIIELGRSGISSERIGQILKDEHGVQSTKELTGKRISKILIDSGTAPKLPADIGALMKKSLAIKKHLIKNKSDVAARYGLLLAESQIRKLGRYYRRTKVLPPDWKYESEVQS